MRVPGWKSVTCAGRWARSRINGAALILGYHRIADADWDPFGLCVGTRNFDEQMAVLRSRATPVPLGSIVEGLDRGGLPRRSVAVTFDDGYADVARNALPVLQRYEIPTTVFVVSGSIGSRFWWDQLASLMRELPDGALEAAVALVHGGEPAVRRRFGGARSERDGCVAAVHRKLVETSAGRRGEILTRLRAMKPAAAVCASGDEVMRQDEVARLARTGLVSIGSHTVSHATLASLPEDEQRAELRASREHLESITGGPVRDLSYPHGSQQPATRRLARVSGYRLACASLPAAVPRRGDRFCLPRFWIPDWDGERFARWLHRWQT